jgi:glycosyltransferase involved in cell wall biosynthesis
MARSSACAASAGGSVSTAHSVTWARGKRNIAGHCASGASLNCLPMDPTERRIGISLGNIGALHDGLGEFSLQIGQRIAQAAPRWKAEHRIAFHFHLRDKLKGLFGNGVGYLPVSRWQRLRHVQPLPFALWHSLHQLNKNLPPQGTGVRLVTVHDLNYLYGRNAISTWRHGRRTRALLGRTDALAAISHHTAADVRRHLGWGGEITVIHNGARSFVGHERTALPGWLDDDPRPFLFHLSRMSPSKNPQALLALAQAWPQMRFVLCGPPSDDAKALQAANRLPNVEFHLGISDAHKAWAYARCAGFLFPSLTEGFGLPPIEAMHFGKPVFLSRLTCLPEIGGDAAFYFDGFDAAHMRQVVEAGLAAHADPVRALHVQRHATRFDWDRAAEAYLALYRRLLDLP